MKLHELLTMCENVKPETNIMIYHSLEDYDCDTSNWHISKTEDLLHEDLEIVKFNVYKDFVSVALA